MRLPFQVRTRAAFHCQSGQLDIGLSAPGLLRISLGWFKEKLGPKLGPKFVFDQSNENGLNQVQPLTIHL